MSLLRAPKCVSGARNRQIGLGRPLNVVRPPALPHDTLGTAWCGLADHPAEEVADVLADLGAVGLQRKVARIEKVVFAVG